MDQGVQEMIAGGAKELVEKRRHELDEDEMYSVPLNELADRAKGWK